MATTTTTTTAAAAHLPPVDSPSHRRIALQSPHDLLYLRAQALKSARAKIDLHLPLEAALRSTSSGLTDDALRRAVETEVDAYVSRVFAAVQQGVEVNGLVYSADGAVDDGSAQQALQILQAGAAAEQQYEAYDTGLAERVIGLHARIEALDMEIAGLRADAAGRAAAEFEEEYAMMAKEEAQTDAPEWLGEEVGSLLGAEGIAWEGRREQVTKAWEQATTDLLRLEEDVERTRAKADRAVGVGTFLDSGAGSGRQEDP